MSQNKILQFIEIDVDYCSLTYGVSPCTASLTSSPPTGTRKCFNTLATCQDRPNFSNAPVTLRFAVPTNFLSPDFGAIANIRTIDFDPATISLGQNLGQRATLTVTFDDHRHSDTGAGGDKYLADRAYDPYSQGTYWGKFAARQPFVRGRPLRWITGNAQDTFLTGGNVLQSAETRHFIIESFTGPDNNGVFKIIAKDVLKLADGDRALAPATSNGYLVADITAAAVSFTVSPVGVGGEYPASGYVALGGSEIVSYSRTGDVFSIVRGQLGTAAADHKAQDRVQHCLRYASQSPDLIINDLLTNYAGVDPAFIPLSQWQSEVTIYLNRVYTGTVAQPTAVNTLISELIEQAGLSMWWDDRNQKIGLLVLRGLIYTTYFFSEQNTIADTLNITEQSDKRLSQVHTYFGQINPLTSLTDKANYRSASVIKAEQSEADYGSAMIKEIFSRWIPQLGRTVADRLGDILIGRFKDPPRKLKFSTLRGSTPEIMLASGYQLQGWPLQDDTGAHETVNMQVTRLRPGADLIEIEAEEVLFTAPAEDLTVRQIIIDANNYNINVRTAHDAIFPAPTAGITVVVTVNAGVKVGSTSRFGAIDVGSWPAGVTIVLHVVGRIQGSGGNGNISTFAGLAGHVALYTRYAVKLSVPLGGQIWGGGGGGGGSYYIDGSGTYYSWGGGGGAGFNGGAGAPSSGGAGSGKGADGTPEAGGAGNGYAGKGGGPGLNGAAGQNAGFGNGAGGAAGAAVDGWSYITTGSWDGTTFTPGALAGSVLGPQVN